MIMKEVFKTVVFRNEKWTSYEVSNIGNVRSVDRVNTFIGKNQTSDYEVSQQIKGRLLKPRDGKGGYLYLNLSDSEKGRKTAKIHRLVAETFIPNPLNKKTVNHINEDKSDNSVDNLEWATTKENNKYGSRLEKFFNVTVYKPNGELYKKYDSLREAEQGLGISRKIIKKFIYNEYQLFRDGGKNTFFKNYTFTSDKEK